MVNRKEKKLIDKISLFLINSFQVNYSIKVLIITFI